jgi:hypothetical protein
VTTKKPSRRQALRAFTAEQREQQAKPQQKPLPPYSDDYWRCRRLTRAELELMRTPEEVAAEIRWARQLLASVDELEAHRASCGRVN